MSGFRRFFLYQDNKSAQGVQFSDGTCILRWLEGKSETATYSSFDEIEGSHRGVRVRFLDPICFACGAALFEEEKKAHHCLACGAGQGQELFYEARPNPRLGSWSLALVINTKEETE